MKDESLDEQYLKWLCGQVGPINLRNPSHTFWNLMGQLYTKEFAWYVPNDDNRLEDGLLLRDEFGKASDDPWWDEPCSVLEMLIALARRLAFEDGGEPASWFWELLENLGLSEFNDRSFFTEDQRFDIDERLENMIHRRYSYSGQGGLFPLEHPHEDQREVEIWYQLSAYLSEREEGRWISSEFA